MYTLNIGGTDVRVDRAFEKVCSDHRDVITEQAAEWEVSAQLFGDLYDGFDIRNWTEDVLDSTLDRG